MGPACVQVHRIGLLWLPLLWLLLSGVCCSHALPGWRFTSSEVVIPRKVSHKVSGAGAQDQLSYKIHFRGHRHVIHMKVKKNLLPRNFPVITDNDQGAMQEDYPFVPRNCYYYSYLEGVPGSMGTLDTCYGGLRGMLQVDDFTYEIKPLDASTKFEHVVSRLVSEAKSSDTARCKIEGEDANPAYEESILAENSRAAPVHFWWPHRKQLKLQYTVSNSLFRLQRNQTRIIENVVILNNIQHSIFQQAHYDIVICMMCIWNKYDHVNLNFRPNISEVVTDFGFWKYNRFWDEFPHDMSVLLTGEIVKQASYFTNFYGMCSPIAGVVYVFVAEYHIFLAATLCAHTLGHSFGLLHDTPGCHCFRRETCLMAPETGLLDMMSNCTYEALHKWTHGFDRCLTLVYPIYDNFPYIAPRCGDKIINQKEECDCGSLKECVSDKCCETHCVLSLGSKCSEGLCCRGCQYAEPGWICRHARGVCDLPEYCDGKTHVCPNDFYVQDGTPCSPLAVCRVGNCTDRDMQCQSLFGLQAKDGPPACYEKLNVIGDRFGNCGVAEYRGGAGPYHCEPENVFCGLLHCSGIDEVPGGGEHTIFHDIIVQDVKQEKCFGYDVHYGTDVPNFGLVVDGASCGPGKYCYEQTCTFYQQFNYDCNISKCNFRGVCNNRGECHCQRGWKPPDCAEVGGGASVNSGPPPDKDLFPPATIKLSINKALALMFLRFILFLLSLFAGVCTYTNDIMDINTEENNVE